ncbi:prolyl oligopeptidase family serine peptidase [Dyella telluris]|uniref:Prolyl oligopeptidase family serine peptidase n=1 Tax=Dyella telluris TaxID=2763498 RepID=A0A7G8QAH2_9GAMM|nr:prolyl oligopeptidase family serine peptidase [Dyella telluris]
MGVACSARADEAHFTASEVTVNGHRHAYQVFVPHGWSADRAWPVVLFLHGSGERGSDNEAQLNAGLPPWLKAHGADFPAVVVVPQAPDDTVWSGEVERAAMAALEQSIKTWHGDRSRLYLTGLSMGGYGAWQLAVDHPGMFAAAVVICGGVQSLDDMPELKVYGAPAGAGAFDWVAQRVQPMPVWIFHGAADDQVPTEESRAMDKALLKVGDPVRYTEYPGVGHGSWLRAYDEPELWPWMFSQRVNVLR